MIRSLINPILVRGGGGGYHPRCFFTSKLENSLNNYRTIKRLNLASTCTFATNYSFLNSISLQPDVKVLLYFKL